MPRPKGSVCDLKKYAVTLVPVKADYKDLDTLQEKFYTIEKDYELETVDKCIEEREDGTPHIHAYMVARKSLFLKADKFKGWSIRVEPIFNLEGWFAYIDKHREPEKPNQDGSDIDIGTDEMPYMFIPDGDNA